MIKKSDWAAVYRDLSAEGRQRLGEPPGADELLAYSRGELSGEEAARIQNLLVYYPELAQTLDAPFPSLDDATDVLSNDELAADWERLQASVRTEPAAALKPDLSPAGSVRRFQPPGPAGRALWTWRLSTLAAALLAAVFGGLYLRSQLDLDHLAQEFQKPRIDFSHRVLLPDRQRGVNQEPILLSPGADYFLLTPALIGHRNFPAYRLDVVDLNRVRPERIWSGTGLHLRDDDSFEIWLPRAFLKPGDYRLELYGLAGGREERLATYTVRLAAG